MTGGSLFVAAGSSARAYDRLAAIADSRTCRTSLPLSARSGRSFDSVSVCRSLTLESLAAPKSCVVKPSRPGHFSMARDILAPGPYKVVGQLWPLELKHAESAGLYT